MSDSANAATEAEAQAILDEARSAAPDTPPGHDPDVADAVAFLEGNQSEVQESKPQGGEKAQDEHGDESEEHSDEADPGDEEGVSENEPADDDEDEPSEDEQDDPQEESEDGTEKSPQRKSRWARKQAEIARLKETVQAHEATVAEYEKHANTIRENVEYAYDQLKQVEAENARLRSRLEEFEISEYPSEEARRIAELESKLQAREQQEQRSQQAQEAARKAALQQKAQQVVTEIRAAAEKYGLDPREVGKSYAAAAAIDPNTAPASVAKEVARVKGLLRKSTKARAQVQASQEAPPTKPQGRTGSENPFRQPGDTDVDEAVRFLETMRRE